ncbi:MAG: hypothetical protein Q4G13_02360 [Moraxella sp.]|nr:hypothetical protein [Moraxella sp.]
MRHLSLGLFALTLFITNVAVAATADNDTVNAADGETSVSVSAPANPHDPNAPSLLELQIPNESELSAANQTLLTKNAELERQVSTLTTQANVLVQERSGQLFMYGAITAGISLFVGLFLGKLIFGRDRW